MPSPRHRDRLIHTDLVILDELGHLVFSQAGGALLFHLIGKLYRKDQYPDHHQSQLLGMAKRVR